MADIQPIGYLQKKIKKFLQKLVGDGFYGRHSNECNYRGFKGNLEVNKISTGSINVDCFHLVFWGYTGC
jgi:hypothetical protein